VEKRCSQVEGGERGGGPSRLFIQGGFKSGISIMSRGVCLNRGEKQFLLKEGEEGGIPAAVRGVRTGWSRAFLEKIGGITRRGFTLSKGRKGGERIMGAGKGENS